MVCEPVSGLPGRYAEHALFELLCYVNKIAQESNLGTRLRCNTVVEAMTWDDDAACWQVDVRDTSETATGQTERTRAHAVIAALGILRVAKYPDFNGRESFLGPTWHSTTWDRTIDLVGKRVGVIGTGASANQIVPALAPDVAQLTVYQRSSHWILSHPKYGKKLETTPIVGITATGVTTRAGHDELYVLVFATGFQADKILWPIHVTGQGGVDVTAAMAAEPEAYLGIAAADAPNLFITPGPNGVLGHGGNGMLFAECHVRFIVESLRLLFERGARSMTVRDDVLRAYTDDILERLPTFVQSLTTFDNWYRGDRDRVVAIAPKSVLEFWDDTRQPDPDAYTFA